MENQETLLKEHRPADMEYPHFIEFVRPRSTHNDDWKHRQNQSIADSAGAISSSISGAEAKSFYEDLCSNDTTVDNGCGSSQSRKRKHRSNLRKKPRKTFDRPDQIQRQTTWEKSNKIVDDTSSGIGKELKIDGNSFQAINSASCVRNVYVDKDSSGDRLSHSDQRRKDYRQTQLLKLAQNGENEDLKLLLQQDVDVNLVDKFGWTAAMSAAFEGHENVVRTLVKAGADLSISNSQGQTALSLARNKGCTRVVKFIESFFQVGLPACKFEQKKNHLVSFYCSICESEFTESDRSTHERSTVHIFNKGKKPKDDMFFISSSNVGFRLMMKTGWDGDTGLGPSGQGQRFPVKTLLKRDRKGLGNTVADKAKVTHFKPNDKSAIVRTYIDANNRTANVRTLSRRAERVKERKKKQWEIKMRQELS